MQLLRSKKGLTLMEIVVSTVLLSLVLVSMANLFVGAKRMFLHSRTRVVGVELARDWLNPLQMDVRQSTWDLPGNNLRAGTVINHAGTDPGNGIAYDGAGAVTNIAVNNGPQSENLRRVVFTVNWNENAP